MARLMSYLRADSILFYIGLGKLNDEQKMGVLDGLSDYADSRIESISDVFYRSLKPIPEGFVTSNEVLAKKLGIV